jgi:hypothetical protein
VKFLTRSVTFLLTWADGKTKQFSKTLLGPDDEVQWVAEQYAEVNNCKAQAFINGKKVCESDFTPKAD